MTQRKPDIAALIGSRICHDLISPLGAIGNGVELLSMSDVRRIPELSLISESVENANARIRLFRVSFGDAPEGSEIPTTEITGILRDLQKGGRLALSIDIDAASVPRSEAKLLLLLFQCLESAMPWGGDVTVARDQRGWSLRASAEKLNLEEAKWQVLLSGQPSADLAPRDVHFALVAQAVHDAKTALKTDLAQSSISLSF